MKLLAVILATIVVVMGEAPPPPAGAAWTPALHLEALDGDTASGGGTINCLLPCVVFGEVSGSTWTEPGDPMFFGVDAIRWDWGERASGHWEIEGRSVAKDIGKGHVSGMVYETAGTKTLTVSFTDLSGDLSTVSATIVVTEFSTIECYALSSTPSTVAPCPVGNATSITSVADLASDGCFSGEKKCLLQAGDTFAATTVTDSTASCNVLGKWGSGADPILDYAAEDIGADASVSNACLILQDIEMTGNGTTGDADQAFNIGAGDSGLAIIRVTLTPNTWHTGVLAGNDTGQARLALWDVTFDDLGLQTSTSNGGTGLYFFGDYLLVGGGQITDVADSGNTRKGEHAVRIKGGDYHSFRGVTIGGGADSKSDWTYRAKGGDTNSFLSIHDVVLLHATNGFNVVRSGASGIDEQRAEYVYIADSFCKAFTGTRSQGENACFSLTPGQNVPSASDNAWLRHIALWRITCNANGMDAGSSFNCIRVDVDGNATDSFCDTPSTDCFNYAGWGVVAFRDSAQTVSAFAGNVNWSNVIEDLECGNSIAHNASGSENTCATGTSFTSLGGNLDSAGTDPFDVVSGEPGDWPSLRITTDSAAAGNGIDPRSSGFATVQDTYGQSVPLATNDSGIYEVNETKTTMRLYVQPDTQDCASDKFGCNVVDLWESMNSRICNASPAIEAVLHVGDIVDDPINDQWDQAEAAYSEEFDSCGIPLYAGIGNHDYDVLASTPPTSSSAFTNAAAWLDARGHPAQPNPQRVSKQLTQDWWVITLPDFYTAADATWATDTMADAPSGAKFILVHHRAADETGTAFDSCCSSDISGWTKVRAVVSGHHVDIPRSKHGQFTLNSVTRVSIFMNGQSTHNEDELPTPSPGNDPGIMEWGYVLDLTPTTLKVTPILLSTGATSWTGREVWGGSNLGDSQAAVTYTVN